ncbi:hypothetical protein ACVNPS_01200 [Candidatus Bipolaricaulota sp. J31]
MRKFFLLLYWLSGRRRYWQYYTNIAPDTCPECLALHGRIARDPADFPARADSCPREFLPFPVWKLPQYREKERRMRALARAELERRELFARAVTALERSPEEALELFDRAGEIEIYLSEVERVATEKAGFLAAHPEIRRRLGEVFLRRWKGKFAKPRYEAWPERMRVEREKWGRKRIEELFLQD